jgi:hypothetical protein
MLRLAACGGSRRFQHIEETGLPGTLHGNRLALRWRMIHIRHFTVLRVVLLIRTALVLVYFHRELFIVALVLDRDGILLLTTFYVNVGGGGRGGEEKEEEERNQQIW